MFLASLREVVYVMCMRQCMIQGVTVLSQGIKATEGSVGPHPDMASHRVTRIHHFCKLSLLLKFSLCLKINFTHLVLDITLYWSVIT